MNEDELKQWKGSGTVLIIDDEDIIRQTLSLMLQFIGFDVLETTNGQEGIDCFRERQQDICAVILDMTMPGLSGDQVLEQLQAIQADVQVLLSSGYSEQELQQQFAECGLAGILQKPFTPMALKEKLYGIMNP